MIEEGRGEGKGKSEAGEEEEDEEEVNETESVVAGSLILSRVSNLYNWCDKRGKQGNENLDNPVRR